MDEFIKDSPMAQFMALMKTQLSAQDYNEFLRKVKEDFIDHPPVVAVIGKAGVGKTSTINNLFDVDDYVIEPLQLQDKGNIGDVRRGTDRPVKKHFDLKIGIGLDIVDLPGLGDDIETDEVFEEFYKEILPGCDIVIYVMDAIDRSFSQDEDILQKVVLPCSEDMRDRIIIAMNKVDLIGAKQGLEWDVRINRPDRRQEELIKKKQKDIAKHFSTLLNINSDKVLCYSAIKKYHLLELLYSIVHTTPMGFIFGLLGLTPRYFTEDMSGHAKELLKIAQSLK